MKKNVNKVVLIILALSAIAILHFYVSPEITGFNTIDVSIKEKSQGIILLDYSANVNLTGTQSITAEFVNTGTSNYTARIELTIYMYNNTTGSLEQLAAYYDNYVLLNPGNRRSFRTSFLPNRVGVYYIKARVPYENKVAEMWGSFFVTYYYDQTPQIIHVVTYYGGGTIPAQREFGVTGLELEYEVEIDAYPGESKIMPIRLNNTGTINLHNLKFYSSTTEYISFEVNPKEIYELGYNESNMFLISIDLSKGIPPGEYDFSFEVLGLEIKRGGRIKINVGSVAKSIMDEVRGNIINYEYLINEVGREAYLTRLRGFNTTRAESYLEDARNKLNRAKDYFDKGEYEDARGALDHVKRDLGDAVFELAAISYKSYIYPAFSPFLILLLLIIIMIALIVVAYLYNKRKKRKPKLIRAFTEEEEA